MALQDLISDFTAIIEKIFSLQEKKQVSLVNILHDHYNNYKLMLQKVSPEEHIEFFLSPFKKNKVSILADKSDSWIRESPVFIQWNEGAKSFNPKYRINLSGIYNTSLRLAKDAKEAFSQMVDKDKLSIEQMYQEVRYPDSLLYHYYKLVHYFLKMQLLGPKGNEVTQEQKDIDSLGSVINKFEQHLNLKTSGDINNVNNSGTGTSTPADVLSTLPLGEVFNSATKVMQQNGIKLPENIKIPSGEEFSGMLQGLFSNPQLQSLVSGLFKSIEGSKTPQEVFGKMANSMANQDLSGIMNSISLPGSSTNTVERESESKKGKEDRKGKESESKKGKEEENVREGESEIWDEGEANISLVQFDD